MSEWMNELTNKSNQLILFIFLLFSWLFGVWILGGTIYPNKPNVSTPFHVVLIGPKPPDFTWLTCRGPARHNFTPSHYDKEKNKHTQPEFQINSYKPWASKFFFFFFWQFPKFGESFTVLGREGFTWLVVA